MEEVKNVIQVAKCPNCGKTLLYREDEAVIRCGNCDSEVSVDRLKTLALSMQNYSNKGVDSVMDSIVNSDSALAFLDEYFEHYDWAGFNRVSDLSVPEIDKMVERLLITDVVNPSTWEFQFRSISIPLYNKIEGLKDLEKRFVDIYVAEGSVANGLPIIKDYINTVKKIISERERILERLDFAIRYAVKYEIKPTILAGLKSEYMRIKTYLIKLKDVNCYSELESFATAYENKQIEIKAKLLENGTDADAIYDQAKMAYDGGDFNMANKLFLSIKGYKDSADYCEKANEWLKFGPLSKQFVKLGGKCYFYRDVVAEAFDPKAKGKNNKKQEDDGKILEMKRKELVSFADGVDNLKVVATGITNILGHDGEKLFYIKDNKTICCFDGTLTENAVKEIEQSEIGDYLNFKGEVKYFEYNRDIYLLKKIKLGTVKTGCAKRKKKQKLLDSLTDNNYSVVCINKDDASASVAIDEVIDVVEVNGNKIYYTRSIFVNGAKIQEFLAYDMDAKEDISIFENEYEIADVDSGKVIYMTWEPTRYNKDIYAYDIQSKKAILLARNVFDFCKTINGKVYYYVGNNENKTLYNVSLEGTDRYEILKDATAVKELFIKVDAVFAVKGSGLNAVLLKLDETGKKYTLLATQYSEMVDLLDGVVYYKDTLNNLCAVRLDGREYRIVANSANLISIGSGVVYFTKEEKANGEDATLKSLYKVDIYGHNLSKVGFAITDAVASEYNEDEIYVSRKDSITYRLDVPVNAKTYQTSYDTREIETYEVYKKSEDKFEVVVQTNVPKEESFRFKAGCLKRKVVKETVIKTVPSKIGFVRDGVASAGITKKEILDYEDENSKKTKKAKKKQAKNEAKLQAKEIKAKEKEEKALAKQEKKDAKNIKNKGEDNKEIEK